MTPDPKNMIEIHCTASREMVPEAIQQLHKGRKGAVAHVAWPALGSTSFGRV